jgi:hypothetical protein
MLFSGKAISMRIIVFLLLLTAASVANAQNVGIGTSAPVYPLHIVRPAGSNTGTAINIHTPISGQVNQAGYIRFTNTVNNDASEQFSSFIGGGRGLLNSCYLVFGTSEEGFPPLEKMRFTGNGRLGIGTNDPQSQLHTTGTARFGGGVLLPGASGTPDTLNYYEEETVNVNFFNGAVTYTSNQQVKLVRVGKQVTMTFPVDILELFVINVQDIIIGPFPPRFMPPVSNLHIPVRVRSGGVSAMGVCVLLGGSEYLFLKPAANGGGWGGVQCGIYATSITYSVQ